MAEKIPFCAHPDCDYQSRFEYCEIEAARPENFEQLQALQAIDYLLYEAWPLESEEFNLTDDNKEQSVTRSFSSYEGDVSSVDSAPMISEVMLYCALDKGLDSRQYEIIMSWRPYNAEHDSDRYEVSYGISKFPAGAVQGFMVEPDLESGGYNERRMTEYDYARLHKELSNLRVLRDVETRTVGS